MPERQTAYFAPSDLRLLLYDLQLDVGEKSPLTRVLDAKVDPGRSDWLDNSGFFTPAWRHALSALCHPDIQTSSVLAYSDVISGLTYYADRSESSTFVGCWPEGDKIHVSFPWEPEAIVARDFAMLEIDRAPRPNIPEMRFSPEGFIVFMAALDAVRMVLLGSLLQRRRLQEFTLPEDYLSLMIRKGFEDEAADSRWLVTLLLMFAPNGFAPVANQSIDGGYRQLMDLGLITEAEGGHWVASSRLVDIASSWLIPVPAVSHETIIVHPDGSEKVTSSLTLRGSGPLCVATFDRPKTSAHTVRFCAMEGGAYWLEILGRLTPPAAMEKKRSAPGR